MGHLVFVTDREMEADRIVIFGVHGTLNSFTDAAMPAASSQVRYTLFFYSQIDSLVGSLVVTLILRKVGNFA